MLDVVARDPFYPRSADELPDWLLELPHAHALKQVLVDGATAGQPTDWTVSISIPHSAEAELEATRETPMLWLAGLKFASARIEEKMAEVVRACRRQGWSWTQIGEVLGMTKQSAWERFSGED